MAAKKISPQMQALADAIRAHPVPAQVALCGFDLWIEVLGSGFAKGRDFVHGGRKATGEEPEGALKVPIMVIGNDVVISFDPTLPPEEFILKPQVG